MSSETLQQRGNDESHADSCSLLIPGPRTRGLFVVFGDDPLHFYFLPLNGEVSPEVVWALSGAFSFLGESDAFLKLLKWADYII